MSGLATIKYFGRRSGSIAVDPSLAVLFIPEVRICQYTTVSLATVLVYHSVITLDKEVKHFRNESRSSIGLIYFANRYIGLLGIICNIMAYGFSESPTSYTPSESGLFTPCCTYDLGQFAYWAASLSGFVTIILIDYILVIRVLAFYHQEKRLAICLKSLLCLEAGVGLGTLIYGNLFQDFLAFSIMDGPTVCGSRRAAPQTLATISWVVPLAYGLVLLSLALYKAAEYWKLSSRFKGFHLVRVLVQDQLLYFGFVIFCCVLKIVDLNIQYINPVVSSIINSIGSPTLLCVLGGQLLINLKDAGERGLNGGTNYTPESMSDIEFA